MKCEECGKECVPVEMILAADGQVICDDCFDCSVAHGKAIAAARDAVVVAAREFYRADRAYERIDGGDMYEKDDLEVARGTILTRVCALEKVLAEGR